MKPSRLFTEIEAMSDAEIMTELTRLDFEAGADDEGDKDDFYMACSEVRFLTAIAEVWRAGKLTVKK